MKWKEYRNQILGTIDVRAFYADEFTKEGLVYQAHGNELKSQCPFTELHMNGQDRNPSFTVSMASGAYLCNACGSKGNIHTYYMHTRNLDKQEAWYALGDALGLERPEDVDSRPAIDPGLPARYHKMLMSLTGVIRDVLKEKRGITDETLKRFMIGWDGERVTLPIYDEFNELVNIRRYKWNSYEDATKMVNFTDELHNTFGEDRIYGIEHLVDNNLTSVLWCEGEWDRLVAEQLGIEACTATAGANNFKLEWLKLIKKKKRIYICYDNDEAGKRATEFLVESLRNSIEIYTVKWPENWREKGDITDIVVSDKYDKEKFMSLFVPLDDQENVQTVSLAVSSNARYTGKRIKVPVLIAGKESSPYIYPRSIKVSCGADVTDSKLCAACLLMSKKRTDITIKSSDAIILKLIGCTDIQQRATLKAVAGANIKCPLADVNVIDYGNLETVHMIPKADIGFGFALRQEYVARSGYVIGNDVPTNKRFTLAGYMHADPNTQKATYVFDQAIPEKDLLDELEITPEVHELLKDFQCAEGQTVAEKFAEIHADLERNVTYIWARRRVAYAVDLVYHSALSFMFQEQQVKRGWTECLIIGDSGQAKTTLVERLMSHYKSGELMSGESSKRTGLVYSLQQTGSRGGWTLIWGAMPLNDGGLLTVDELSGMPEEDLAKMSDVRSSGIAKASGVITAETTARTRMIFISNPRNGRQLRFENYGVAAILKLWGKAEDVRRLDFAIAVASGEVDSDVVNKSISDMPKIPHRYTTDKCKMRVMWAWSRRPENISFTPEAATLILQSASKMGKKYSSRIPLVEPADQRLKIARLATAAAICVYSTTDGTDVIVKEEHVEFAVNYLNDAYDSKSLGYDRFSADEFESSDTTDSALAKIRETFLGIPFMPPKTEMDIIRALYQLPYFSRNTLEDATGVDRDELRNLMQFLISNSIVEKAQQDYRRTPLGLTFIEQMLMNPPDQREILAAREKRYTNKDL